MDYLNKNIQSIDTRYSFFTPEGIEIEFAPAGLGIRLVAYIIDFLIFGVFILVSATIWGILFNGYLMGLFFIFIFLSLWFYEVVFEVFRNGQTFGKKIMGLKVIMEDGTPVRIKSSIIRSIMRFADFLPGFYTAGIMSILFSPKFQRLGDLTAGTLVIYEEPLVSYAAHKASDTIEVTSKPQLPFGMTKKEKKILLAFESRKNIFSTERQEEIAETLGLNPGEVYALCDEIIGGRLS